MTEITNTKRAQRAITAPKVALTVSGLLLLGGWATAGNSQAGGGAPALKPGAGQETFVENCSACHSVAMSTNSPRTSDEWRDTINKMIGNGAEITPEEFTAIHGYL